MRHSAYCPARERGEEAGTPPRTLVRWASSSRSAWPERISIYVRAQPGCMAISVVHANAYMCSCQAHKSLDRFAVSWHNVTYHAERRAAGSGLFSCARFANSLIYQALHKVRCPGFAVVPGKPARPARPLGGGAIAHCRHARGRYNAGRHRASPRPGPGALHVRTIACATT